MPAPCLSSAGTSSNGPREQVAGKRGVHSQTTHFCQTALGVNHLVLVSVFRTPPPTRHSALTAYGSERGYSSMDSPQVPIGLQSGTPWLTQTHKAEHSVFLAFDLAQCHRPTAQLDRERNF
ncbi:hypothetical protein MHYP_G00279700 [Metynnis hypsauchen]